MLARTVAAGLEEKGYAVAVERRIPLTGGHAEPNDERHFDKVLKYSGREFFEAVKMQYGSSDV